MTDFDPKKFTNDIDFADLAFTVKQYPLNLFFEQLFDAFRDEGYRIENFIDALTDYCYKHEVGGDIRFLEEAAAEAIRARRSTGRTQQEIDADWEALKQTYAAKGFSEEEFLKAQLANSLMMALPTELREAKRKKREAFED